MSQRYRKEIEEILEHVEGPPVDQERGNKPPQKGRKTAGDEGAEARLGGKSASIRGWRVSPGRLMLASVAFLLSALVLKFVVPGLVGPVAWTGVGLFIIAYVLFFVKPRSPVEKRWRGRLLEDPSSGPPLWQRIRRWLNKK